MRFSAFHQLDVRVDKSFYLKKITAKLYIDIQNLYNFQAQQQDIVVRQKDASGNYITTDNGTKYVLESVENTLEPCCLQLDNFDFLIYPLKNLTLLYLIQLALNAESKIQWQIA